MTICRRLSIWFLFILISFVHAEAIEAWGKKGSEKTGVHLQLYKEKSQEAFYILIPKGWKAEGGMIPSGVDWNVVDLVENNIKFRVTSPDGKSFFGWYPKFYFQDPKVFLQSSGGMMQLQHGQVMNGCWIYPFLNVSQYVEYIVFRQFAASEYQNPRITSPVIKDPSLKPWVPKIATQSDYGYVNFECTRSGVQSYGRTYSINYDLQGAIWSTVGTFGWLAPKSRWKKDERIMEMCLRSFKLNPRWVKRAAAASRKRAKQYHQVVQHMNRIDQEISNNRSQTRSDIQEEFYKVITEQIETYDPELGKKTYLPMYNHAYTDGNGNYFLSDYDDGTLPFDNASEWRKLKIINRNAPNYKPED